MFEKEAEEYLKKDGTKAEQKFNVLNEISPLKITLKQLPFMLAMLKQIFQDGAEFGYKKGQSDQLVHKQYQLNQLRKANEWHYVKDGDLPTETKEYLVYKIDGYGCKSIQVKQFNNKHCWCANCQNEIIAWKEIVLPEPSKESE